MAKAKLAEVIQLKAGLRETIKKVYAELPEEYEKQDYVSALAQGMRDSGLDMNDYIEDVAGDIVDAEEKTKSAQTPKDEGGQLQFDAVQSVLFHDDAIFKLGGSRRVKAKSAKMQHGLVHMGKLNGNSVSASQSAARFAMVMSCSGPYLETNPSLTLNEAWNLYLLDNPEA